MDVISEGKGKLIAGMTRTEAREGYQNNKSRALIDKRMTMKDAVSKFVNDGDFIASGGSVMSRFLWLF